MCYECEERGGITRRGFLKSIVGLGIALAATESGVLLPATALAAPTIYSCSQWGAQAPRSAINVLGSKPNKIIIHHTASANTTDYSLSQAYSLARSIQQSHFSRGWIDSGQQFTISRGGYILEGRHRSLEILNGGSYHVEGAHCDGQNTQAIGIENEGNYMSVTPPTALYNKIVDMCVYICQQYGLPGTAIYGHRDFNATDCPGDKLYVLLPQIRNDVTARLGGPISTWPVVRRGDSGERVKSVQYLLRARGYTSVTADGIFGAGTESAVKSFQSSRGVTADGVVGQNTWLGLILTVRYGDSGEAVKAVQSQLRTRWGYTSVTVDGAFGPGTEGAVKSFQSSKGLTADGIVGQGTWQALVQ